MEMYSSELFSLELLREKFENGLEISGKTQGIYLLKNMVTLILYIRKFCDVNIVKET